MPDLSLNRMTAEARSLADRIGVETTEALIRAASGVQQTSGEGLAAAMTGAKAVGKEVGHEITEGVQVLALPTGSARAAWRAGRFVGRIEGAMKLALFGIRLWWRRRGKSRREGQSSPANSLRVVAQWAPTIIASIWLMVQIIRRVRRVD